MGDLTFVVDLVLAVVTAFVGAVQIGGTMLLGPLLAPALGLSLVLGVFLGGPLALLTAGRRQAFYERPPPDAP